MHYSLFFSVWLFFCSLLSLIVVHYACDCSCKVIKTFSKNVEGCRDGSAKNHRN